jgi:hypothetical protein
MKAPMFKGGIMIAVASTSLLTTSTLQGRSIERVLSWEDEEQKVIQWGETLSSLLVPPPPPTTTTPPQCIGETHIVLNK